MKQLFIFLFVALLSFCTFGQQPVLSDDGTPSFKVARKTALNYAIDNVFADILDEGSSVSIVEQSEDQNRFVFLVTAQIHPQVCTVEVAVSKETGMAFNDKSMSCK